MRTADLAVRLPLRETARFVDLFSSLVRPRREIATMFLNRLPPSSCTETAKNQEWHADDQIEQRAGAERKDDRQRRRRLAGRRRQEPDEIMDGGREYRAD